MKKGTVQITSLGCPKNLVDSEVMASLLLANGFDLTSRRDDASIVIINTCAFILPAKEEAIDEILEAVLWKKGGPGRYVVVAGCLPQRYKKELRAALPEVDMFLGISEVSKIGDYLDRLLRGDKKTLLFVGKPTFLMNALNSRVVFTPPGSAYIKISEGCSNRCSFCVIPAIRGRARSRRIDDIVEEATGLVFGGVRELTLIAQDTTAYGLDLKEKPSLTTLLAELAKINGLRWIRLLYLHPGRVTNDLLEMVANEEKICKYLDIPIQHCDDSILRAMRRRGDSSFLRQLISQARDIIPGVAIRTSLIVGFPGETRRRFEKLLAFIQEIRFDHLGVFRYSREEGSEAASFPYRISEQEKIARQEILMEEQANISRDINNHLIGTMQEVLVEGKSGRKAFPVVGRCKRQALDIDGVTYLKGGNPKPGTIVTCRITGADDYDLFGEITVRPLKNAT